MTLGEFESTKAIKAAVPEFSPTPIARGTLASNPDCHFYICSYHELNDTELPDVQRFSSQVAALHHRAKSPNGKFGFHVTTYQGNLPHENTWADTWEEFFVESMKKRVKDHLKNLLRSVMHSSPRSYHAYFGRWKRRGTTSSHVSFMLIYGMATP